MAVLIQFGKLQSAVAVEANQTEVRSSSSPITTNGSVVVSSTQPLANKSVSLIVNHKLQMTGAGSMQFSVQEVDPIDLTTPIGAAQTGNVWAAGNTNQPGTEANTEVIPLTISGSAVIVSWQVSGTASAAVNLTLVNKAA